MYHSFPSKARRAMRLLIYENVADATPPKVDGNEIFTLEWRYSILSYFIEQYTAFLYETDIPLHLTARTDSS